MSADAIEIVKLGYGLEEDLLEVSSIEDLIFDLEALNILPPEDIERLADCWAHDGFVTLLELEDWLESLPEMIEGLSLEQWGTICLRICPQLYGEPDSFGCKASRAAPRTKAKMAALRRRYEGQSPLFHPRDTDGLQGLEHRTPAGIIAQERNEVRHRTPADVLLLNAARRMFFRLIRLLVKALRHILHLLSRGKRFGLLLHPLALLGPLPV